MTRQALQTLADSFMQREARAGRRGEMVGVTGLEPAASDAEPIEPQEDTEAERGDYNADDNTWLGKLVCEWPKLSAKVRAKIVKLADLD